MYYDIFRKILKTKSDQNTPLNAPNCNIKKNSRGSIPRTALAKHMVFQI